jgi:RecB family endonuclease NucS
MACTVKNTKKSSPEDLLKAMATCIYKQNVSEENHGDQKATPHNWNDAECVSYYVKTSFKYAFWIIDNSEEEQATCTQIGTCNKWTGITFMTPNGNQEE